MNARQLTIDIPMPPHVEAAYRALRDLESHQAIVNQWEAPHPMAPPPVEGGGK